MVVDNMEEDLQDYNDADSQAPVQTVLQVLEKIVIGVDRARPSATMLASVTAITDIPALDFPLCCPCSSAPDLAYCSFCCKPIGLYQNLFTTSVII